MFIEVAVTLAEVCAHVACEFAASKTRYARHFSYILWVSNNEATFIFMMTLANVYYININNYFTVEFKNEMQRKLYKLLPPHKSVARLLF